MLLYRQFDDEKFACSAMTEIAQKGCVLLVDDDESILRAIERFIVTKTPYDVQTALDGRGAIEKLRLGKFDVVVTDMSMPGMDGIELLRRIRAHDLDIPVLIMTGSPDISSAIRAVEYGALRYLVKPVALPELLEVIGYAMRMSKMGRIKRDALAMLGDAEKFVGDRAGLETRFARAVEGIRMVYQPIVRWSSRKIYAYEALLRTTEPSLGNPNYFLGAAENLGRLHELGRAIRKAIATVAAEVSGSQLFVNLHTLDLNDESLFERSSSLAPFAQNVVLEITERASLDKVNSLSSRLLSLRELGYRIALDDLGAGYAGLTSFAQLEPEVAKIDMTLVRGIDRDPLKQKLVGSMTSLSHEMGITVIVEGVESAAERDTLVGLGCDLFQGYLFAKPAPPFPNVAW